MKSLIYLDANATTPVDPRVFEAMKPYFCEVFGNASSNSHAFGWDASFGVEKARDQVARLLGGDKKQIVFTSGATESNNLVILGMALSHRESGIHMVTTATEHKAILEVCCAAKKWGAEITVLPVDRYGQVTPAQVLGALKSNTRLVSVMWANNEIGTLNPITEIAKALKEKRPDIYFHSDAAQAFGKVPINVTQDPVDFISISGHKIYGPKGVGVLYVKSKSLPFEPLMAGGSQERGLRPGTLNVPGIVGLGVASEVAGQEMKAEEQKLSKWRDHIISEISQAVPGCQLNGHPKERLANNVSLSFQNLPADLFALGLSGLAISSGSACTSGEGKPSHVLKAIGLSDEMARSTIRIGLSRFTREADLEVAIAKIKALGRELAKT